MSVNSSFDKSRYLPRTLGLVDHAFSHDSDATADIVNKRDMEH